LTPDAFKLLLGRRYNRVKKRQGGAHGNQYVAKGQIDPLPTTAERLAAEHGVSPATVYGNKPHRKAHTMRETLHGPCITCPELPGSPACDGCELKRQFLEQSRRAKAHTMNPCPLMAWSGSRRG
jgi:hypothetical protein